jgi:hypothetical protein
MPSFMCVVMLQIPTLCVAVLGRRDACNVCDVCSMPPYTRVRAVPSQVRGRCHVMPRARGTHGRTLPGGSLPALWPEAAPARTFAPPPAVQQCSRGARGVVRDRAEVLLVHPLPAPAFRALGPSGVAARHAAQHAAARPDRQTSWGESWGGGAR